MKNILFISKVVFFLLTSISINAQINQDEGIGGEYIFPKPTENCLTNSQRLNIKAMLQRNINDLELQGKINANRSVNSHVLFDWPVKKSNQTNYSNVWAISNFIDHNPSVPNQITDYNCGTRSYDLAEGYNHKGIDIFTWPFTWKQFEDNSAEVVAAESGIIIGKVDGNYDRNCDFSSPEWNAVYIMHNDGSVAWYGHLKNGSLTTKNYGDTVARGEFLGNIGSSGNSTGPHLHFEVYADSNSTQLIDPFAGNCNTLNTDSWWSNQRPYYEPSINHVATHSDYPIFPSCPQTETPNFSNQFNPGQLVHFYAYLKDQVAGTTLYYRLYRPNGSIHAQYDHYLQNNYTSSFWYWSRNDLTITGYWTLQFIYNNQTVNHSFYVGNLDTNEQQVKKFNIHPNPAQDFIKIESVNNITSLKVIDNSGKLINEFNSKETIKQIEINHLPKGTYILSATDSKGNQFTQKFIKK